MVAYAGYVDLEIGASVLGLAALSTLTHNGSNANVPMPKTSFQEFAAYRTTADGNVRGLGKPIISWIWEQGLHHEAWNALRDQLTDPDLSGVRYIASPDKDGDMQDWACVLQWDQSAVTYERFDYRQKLVLRFVRCVQQ